MTFSDLLTPWLLLIAVLIPLIFAEKWIHSHLYGVGWLLTNEKQSATILYYLILFPGVFLHEFIQWLVAGAINVPTKRLTTWPEPQENGTLRLDFVQIQPVDRIRSAIIGAVPFAIGIVSVWLISTRILDLSGIQAALSSGEIKQLGPALREAGKTSDFYLWLYVIFAIGNAMLPTPTDRRGWPLIIGIFAGVIGFLVLIGVGDVLLEAYTGSITRIIKQIATAFAIILGIELWSVLLIGFTEEILERITKRKFNYKPAAIITEREPGSNLPLPPGVPLPSIYNLMLPVPSPSAQKLLVKTRKTPIKPEPERPIRSTPITARLETPAVESGSQRPAGPITDRPAAASADRPGLARPETPTGDRPGFQRPAGPPTDRPAAASGDRPGPARPETPTGDRPGFQRPAGPPTERPAAQSGDRPTRPETPAGDRPGFQRPAGPPTDRPAAQSGDRPARPETPTGDRPGFQRPAGPPTDRPAAQSGDRPARPETPAGDRPGFQRPASPPTERPAAQSGDRPARPETPTGDRPGLQRPSGPPTERPAAASGDRPGTTRPETPTGNRPGFQRPAGPPTERPATPSGIRPATPPGDRPVAPTPGFRGPEAPGIGRAPEPKPAPPDEDEDDGDDITYVDIDDI